MTGEQVEVRLPQRRIERRAVWWWMLRALVRWGAPLAVLM